MASLKSEGINHVCIAVAVQVPTERVWKVGEAILSGYLLVMTNIEEVALGFIYQSRKESQERDEGVNVVMILSCVNNKLPHLIIPM